MMNEPEKSDPSTVAAKPANKTGRLDAESVEPREGASGLDQSGASLIRVEKSCELNHRCV
jgi:hypothetical protein